MIAQLLGLLIGGLLSVLLWQFASPNLAYFISGAAFGAAIVYKLKG